MKRLISAWLIVFYCACLLNSCKPTASVRQNQPPPGAIVLWPNVHIIDSTKWFLYNGYGQPGNGDYSYGFTDQTPNININPGDIIVGTTNGGYIRKVLSMNLANDRLNLYTAQATMADVFRSGCFTLQLPIVDPNNPGSSSITRNFSNVNLSYSPFAMTMVYGRFDIQPSVSVSFCFDSTGLTNFSMSTTNTSSRDTFSVYGLGTEIRSWSSTTKLANITTNSIQWVQAWGNILVPIVYQIGMTFSSRALGSLAQTSDSVNVKSYWASDCNFTGGLQYSSGLWTPLHAGLAYNRLYFDSSAKLGISTIEVDNTDQISSLFYGVQGPLITVGYTGFIGQSIAYPFNYNQGTTGWSTLQATQPVTPIFGRNMTTFNANWTFDSVFFQTPYLFARISASNDTGNLFRFLPNPLVVKVTDSNGNPANNVLVTFSVITTQAGGEGGLGSSGSQQVVNIFTDVHGIAQTTWKLGVRQGIQQVQAVTVNGLHQPISGAPVIFSALAE